MIILVLITFGLCLGSFVNAFVWRLHEGKDWVRGRSECVHCHHQLAPQDLVPVVSWLMLRGKCRYCHKPISWQYPIVELLTAGLFVFSYYFWPLAFHGAGLLEFVIWLVFLVGFVALAVYDLKWFELPNKAVYPLIILALAQLLIITIFYNGGLWYVLGGLWGVLILAGVFYVLFQLSNGQWIGGGDVKLGACLGLLVGGPFMSVLLLFVASCSGTVVALPFLAAGKANQKTRIPFGPLLLLGAIIVRLFGASIQTWFTQHLA